MARFEAAPGLEALVAQMIAPQVEEIAEEVAREARRLEPGLKRWQSVMDGRQCGPCAAMHGVTIPTNDLFEVPAFEWETRERGVRFVYMSKPRMLEPGQEAAAVWWEKHRHTCRCRAVPAGDYDEGIDDSGVTVAGTRVSASATAQGEAIVVAEFGTVHGSGRFPVEGERFMGQAAQNVARRRNRNTRLLGRGTGRVSRGR